MKIFIKLRNENYYDIRIIIKNSVFFARMKTLKFKQVQESDQIHFLLLRYRTLFRLFGVLVAKQELSLEDTAEWCNLTIAIICIISLCES